MKFWGNLVYLYLNLVSLGTLKMSSMTFSFGVEACHFNINFTHKWGKIHGIWSVNIVNDWSDGCMWLNMMSVSSSCTKNIVLTRVLISPISYYPLSVHRHFLSHQNSILVPMIWTEIKSKIIEVVEGNCRLFIKNCWQCSFLNCTTELLSWILHIHTKMSKNEQTKQARTK